jgi:hypothetical protein
VLPHYAIVLMEFSEKKPSNLWLAHKILYFWAKIRLSVGRQLKSMRQCALALCTEVGKHRLFGLARVCIASEDKKRQDCELHKAVSPCHLDAIRNRASQPRRRSVIRPFWLGSPPQSGNLYRYSINTAAANLYSDVKGLSG